MTKHKTMIIRKYRFSIATTYIQSEYSQVMELQFDDNDTEEEIEQQVDEIYTQWLFEHNQGGYRLIEI